jgi:thymidylate synthase (FAD)
MNMETIPVLDHGEVEYIDSMGSDLSIVRAAKVSYGTGQPDPSPEEQRRLIRYLMRHRHTSPFEMAEVQIRLKMPIFVARQWVRHRTASINEVSARYKEVPDDYHMPEVWRGQAKINKQGSEGVVTHGIKLFYGAKVDFVAEEAAFAEYQGRLASGVAREQARGCLPLSTYTEFVWKMDLHNLMHFLKLRLDSHAQEETRLFAQAVASIVKQLFPISWEAFEDYSLNAITLSVEDQRRLSSLLSGDPSKYSNPGDLNCSEHREFEAKVEKMHHA